MPPRGFQEALLRLYTDPGLRQSFFSNDDTVFADLPLTGRERALLRELRTQHERVRFFCDVLDSKRRRRVEALVPTLRAFLGPQWNELWTRYADSQTSANAQSLDEHARALLVYVLANERINADPTMLAAVTRYERCRLDVLSWTDDRPAIALIDPTADLAPLVQRPFLVRRFDLDIASCVQALGQQGNLPAVSLQATTILFYRNWDTGNVATAKVQGSIQKLLNLCDGTTTVRCLARSLGEGMEAPGSLKILMARMCLLADRGVLCFVRPRAVPPSDSPERASRHVGVS